MAPIRPLQVHVRDSCFCHWPVSPPALGSSIPDWLTVDTIDGEAWLTVTAHTVERIESFGIDLSRPAQEIAVRTCVRGPNDQRGVYFFDLFTNDRRTAVAASNLLRLPYRHGTITTADEAAGETRRRSLDSDGTNLFELAYTVGDTEPAVAPPDSLAQFLVERDRYFTTGAFGIPLLGSVGHEPYQLSPVEATVSSRLFEVYGLPDDAGAPLFQYSPNAELSLAPPTPLAPIER